MPSLEVADSLLPIKEKLESIISRLNKLKKHDSVPHSQLHALQDELEEIDKLYVDEKFVINGEIPEGQAILAELLNDAHKAYHEALQHVEDEEDGKCDDRHEHRHKHHDHHHGHHHDDHHDHHHK